MPALRAVEDVSMTSAPDLRIVMPNRADNVAVVRRALAGVAGATRLDEALLADMKIAVSEACNNVVAHAYGGEEGPIEIDVFPESEQLTVVVSDHGDGIHPRPADPTAAMQGVGLSLIQALTESVEIGGGGDEGTEVKMVFDAGQNLDFETFDGGEDLPLPPPPDGDVRLSVCGVLVGPVLGSVASMVAARGGFSMERLSDAQILTDAVAAHAGVGFEGRHVHVGISHDTDGLHLVIGPLVEGGAQRLMDASAVGGLEPLFERITDELAVEGNGSETLRLTLSQHAIAA
jgi:serine/threonine-protein kinase RsbW